MPKTAIKSKRLFILDTNVLMHDPTALFRFKEHDIYLPMIVLEEMDAGKKGLSEVARNVRQVSRFIDQLMQDIGTDDIDNGIPLNTRTLVEGIEDLQILYGQDTDTDDVPNFFVDAASITDMAQAVSVRFTLIARTLESNITTDGGRIARNFTSTVTLRNRLP